MTVTIVKMSLATLLGLVLLVSTSNGALDDPGTTAAHSPFNSVSYAQHLTMSPISERFVFPESFRQGSIQSPLYSQASTASYSPTWRSRSVSSDPGSESIARSTASEDSSEGGPPLGLEYIRQALAVPWTSAMYQLLPEIVGQYAGESKECGKVNQAELEQLADERRDYTFTFKEELLSGSAQRAININKLPEDVSPSVQLLESIKATGQALPHYELDDLIDSILWMLREQTIAYEGMPLLMAALEARTHDYGRPKIDHLRKCLKDVELKWKPPPLNPRSAKRLSLRWKDRYAREQSRHSGTTTPTADMDTMAVKVRKYAATQLLNWITYALSGASKFDRLCFVLDKLWHQSSIDSTPNESANLFPDFLFNLLSQINKVFDAKVYLEYQCKAALTRPVTSIHPSLMPPEWVSTAPARSPSSDTLVLSSSDGSSHKTPIRRNGRNGQVRKNPATPASWSLDSDVSGRTVVPGDRSMALSPSETGELSVLVMAKEFAERTSANPMPSHSNAAATPALGVLGTKDTLTKFQFLVLESTLNTPPKSTAVPRFPKLTRKASAISDWLSRTTSRE
ncbi:hypothetical protein IWQ60_001986 [Tieghemiomyces parasiticus]|uniref:Uncharacterized protein n=1 Tax=Tieghemiomyces parasiticus TaxID=78921 RepID=A0A9W8DW35_9FUNG|nr:hypothetical protein IWQ60_001986 [Tieghemiomyces parasiticus]